MSSNLTPCASFPLELYRDVVIESGMTKRKYPNTDPETVAAGERAVVKIDAALNKYRTIGERDFLAETVEERQHRLDQSFNKKFVRKRGRFFEAQKGRCSCCERPMVNERGHENSAILDYLVLPVWDGPVHEINMVMVCHTCAMKGVVRSGSDYLDHLRAARDALPDFLARQHSINVEYNRRQ